jgi:BirA family transcriptional regulator, biotin operon repressor / biotin---[acetyl-CoA-carboxylase] ligase
MPFQPTLVRFESIDSTNLEAMRQARNGAPEGLCIAAREQSAGRGRLERSWNSRKDAGIYFSIVLRPEFETSFWPLLTLMAALAVVDALLKSCGVRADIKWPNDVYVNERKVCGILAETTDTPSGPAAVIGIGINLTNGSLPVDLLRTATSIEEVTGQRSDPEKILTELIKAIAERYETLQTADGREHTIREWCAHSTYAFDRRVRVSFDSESFVGVTRGLDGDGALRVETADGKLRLVRAGDVTALRAYRDQN